MSTINIPPDWTPEQALAVFELVDTLRDQIGDMYALTLLDACRRDREASSSEPAAFSPDEDEPF